MKRQMLLTVLLLLAVSSLIPTIYATTTNQQNKDIANQTTTSGNTVFSEQTSVNQSTTATTKPAVKNSSKTQINQNTKTAISPENASAKQNTGTIQYAQRAAGSSNVQSNWFTTQQITEAAGRVTAYINSKHKLPNYVSMGSVKVTMPEFLKLLTTGLIQVNKGITSKIELTGVTAPKKVQESIKSGSLSKATYLSIATRVQSFINSDSRAPNFATSSLGKMGYQSLIYTYSNIMSYKYKNKVLPSTVSIKPWSSVIKSTSVKTTTNSTSKTTNTTVKTSNQTGFTISQIGVAAGSVKSFVEKNKRLPNYVKINAKQVTMPQFLQLLNTGLLQINSNKLTSVALKNAGAPASPSESVKSGDINKAGYIDLANRIQKYMNTNGKAPNYASSTLGKIRYETLVYMESRIVNFQVTKKVLPNYAAVSPWTTSTSTVPSSLAIYLKATKNCQSNSATIKNLAASITKGKTTTLAKATAIFNWVNDHTVYSFYYNTVRGALGTLSDGKGNCVDTSHLLIALNRAAGIPARYEQGYCKFSDGWFGHVWAQVYVNGKWYLADAISPRNTFGVINNWDTSTWTYEGVYAELPF